MILLNAIVKVSTLADANGFQIRPCSILEPIGSIAGQDGLLVSLAAIDDDPFRTAMPLERLSQEPLGRSQVPPLTEPELNRIAVAVDGTVEIPPLSTDLDICLVDMPPPGDGSLA